MLPTHSQRFEPALDDDGTRLLTGYDAHDDADDDLLYTTSGSETETDSQGATDDEAYADANGHAHAEPRHLASAHSLGKMVPHPQATLVPVYDARRCRTLVLESRDRDLGREHLFRFTVRFQPPQTQPSQTERLEERALVARNAQRQALGNDSSYATRITPEQQARMDAAATAEAQCLPPPSQPPRSCTVLERFEHVSALRCQHAVFPRYPHMQCVNYVGATTPLVEDAKVAVPVDIEAKAVPETLAGTGEVVRCCTWACLPGDDSPLHVHYRPTNCKVEYAAPMAALEALTLTIHTPEAPLLKDPFDASRTPDVHRVAGITVTNGGDELQLTLVGSPNKCANPLNKGDVVSLRDIGWVDVGALTAEQQDLRTFLCGCVAALRLVVLEDVTATTVRLDLTKSGANAEAAAVDGVTLEAGTGKQLVADATWLLNESLQYRLYVDVECVVRRLAQRTAVEAL